MSYETMSAEPMEGESEDVTASERLEVLLAGLRAMIEDKYPDDKELKDQICAVEKALGNAEKEAVIKSNREALADVPGLPNEGLHF